MIDTLSFNVFGHDLSLSISCLSSSRVPVDEADVMSSCIKILSKRDREKGGGQKGNNLLRLPILNYQIYAKIIQIPHVHMYTLTRLQSTRVTALSYVLIVYESQFSNIHIYLKNANNKS